MEYAPLGIRINAVCSGVIDTPMGGGMGPDAIKEIMRDQPIARLGHPWRRTDRGARRNDRAGKKFTRGKGRCLPCYRW
jgi:NAD(P)-dependent dehydrogenase (short-subunit alcohol dehydrogenase family)